MKQQTLIEPIEMPLFYIEQIYEMENGHSESIEFHLDGMEIEAVVTFNLHFELGEGGCSEEIFKELKRCDFILEIDKIWNSQGEKVILAEKQKKAITDTLYSFFRNELKQEGIYTKT